MAKDTATKIVELPLDANWRACEPESRHEGRIGQFRAYLNHYVVRIEVPGVGHSDHYGFSHGDFGERHAAQLFAFSAGGTRGSVIEVSPYWYVPSYGRVE